MSELSLSLYQIENDLLSLIQMREEAARDYDTAYSLGPATADAQTEFADQIKAIDGQIAEYCKAEIRKVDGIAGLWRHFETNAVNARCEAKRLQAVSAAWDARLDRLKKVCQFAMESFEWRAGKPRVLEGRHSKLYLKANGGKQAVEVSDESLVPEEFMRYSLEMNGETWAQIWKTMGPEWIKENVGKVSRTPALSLIGDVLAKDEPVAGCRLLDRGQHVECR